jgi:hypothetical protein
MDGSIYPPNGKLRLTWIKRGFYIGAGQFVRLCYAQKLPVNLDEVLNGKLDQDLELRPGDVVIVPQRALF